MDSKTKMAGAEVEGLETKTRSSARVKEVGGKVRSERKKKPEPGTRLTAASRSSRRNKHGSQSKSAPVRSTIPKRPRSKLPSVPNKKLLLSPEDSKLMDLFLAGSPALSIRPEVISEIPDYEEDEIFAAEALLDLRFQPPLVIEKRSVP